MISADGKHVRTIAGTNQEGYRERACGRRPLQPPKRRGQGGGVAGAVEGLQDPHRGSARVSGDEWLK